MISFLKLAWWIARQLWRHSLDAGYDLYRQLRYSNWLYRPGADRQKLESLLYFYYHKIEKALALPRVKPLFGLDYIEPFLNLMDQWLQLTGDLQAVVFCGAYASLAGYYGQVGDALRQQRPDLSRRIERFLSDHKIPGEKSNLGGVVAVTAEELQAARQVDFHRLVHLRHSVRNFSARRVPDSAIVQAVKLAQQTPSVCNRQCWRVHVYTSGADKARVLQHQNGNLGFGHLADRVLLITADLRAFVSSGERNQAYTDAGMFAMTLVYALQAQGIASCCLNLSVSAPQDRALRRACAIPRWQNPIMMIAIGYPVETLRVAVSARAPTESLLSFRELEPLTPRMGEQ